MRGDKSKSLEMTLTKCDMIDKTTYKSFFIILYYCADAQPFEQKLDYTKLGILVLSVGMFNMTLSNF